LFLAFLFVPNFPFCLHSMLSPFFGMSYELLVRSHSRLVPHVD
jgi:hypothetical protein